MPLAPPRLPGSPAHAGMARSCVQHQITNSGFPRPRGDGPALPAGEEEADKVPPPTRGWPLDGLVHQHVRVGFPRPRGDGPISDPARRLILEVPPPTRGWPVVRVEGQRAGAGSPAHAGMAPRRRAAARCARGFPRPRGDGPGWAASVTGEATVPPPTRGWPHVIGVDAQRMPGSPAHAGMARGYTVVAADNDRFPRPRGDGPQSLFALCGPPAVPPPTRGWPPDFKHARPAMHGSPAHAGMAPAMHRRAQTQPRFPRPRGDGPRGDGLVGVTTGVPPPTRGWPRYCVVKSGLEHGSPAHAGMAR